MGKTSTEVKQRYLDKVYTQIAVRVPKELAAEFKRVCAVSGTPQRQVFIEAITNFIKNE